MWLADEKSLAAWTKYSLPETEKQERPWLEQERQCGFGLTLDKLVGAGKLFQGVAFMENLNATPQSVQFNTGAQLQGIWLNGERIYKHEKWHGWHAGRDRISAGLKPGRNVVLIESGTQFFLSATPGNQW